MKDTDIQKQILTELREIKKLMIENNREEISEIKSVKTEMWQALTYRFKTKVEWSIFLIAIANLIMVISILLS